ncbi:winged helix-turn-helix transcriptional regulator [Kitasatospora purpeofusca]|uniref:winged helix-turn-helix transcriptional regulator n=1 Tax=Kitasatospora purpeofusca TaxID=67352 RepID=UPI0033C713B8
MRGDRLGPVLADGAAGTDSATDIVRVIVPPRVEYGLTELGRSLAGPISALREWTEAHINDIERARSARPADRGATP